jgi:hypothetical protein
VRLVPPPPRTFCSELPCTTGRAVSVSDDISDDDSDVALSDSEDDPDLPEPEPEAGDARSPAPPVARSRGPARPRAAQTAGAPPPPPSAGRRARADWRGGGRRPSAHIPPAGRTHRGADPGSAGEQPVG